jgi:hypothetical protein
MFRILPVVLAILLPTLAFASVSPEEAVLAMDVDPLLIVPGSIEAPGTAPGMLDTVTSHGVIAAWEQDMALLYTGSVDGDDPCDDHDWPGSFEVGDHVTLSFELEVPDTANSFSFFSYFLSREYPEWVGSSYNDVYQVTLEGEAYTGSIVFDAFGNPVTVNSALFAVVDAASLAGTCFTNDGGTGWVQTSAPVIPGDTIRITFELWDESDGLYDSMALVDGFAFSEDEIEEPETVGDEPLRLAFVSPKEGPLEGGGDVTLHGFGFGSLTEVWWGGVQLTDLVIGTGGETLRVQGIPGSQEARSVDVTVVDASESVTLEAAYTYHVASDGAVPPAIVQVVPGTVSAEGGTEVQVVGSEFAPGAQVWIVGHEADDLAAAVTLDIVVQDDAQRITAELPAHAAGWTELLVVNPDGGTSEPGYPLLFSDDVAAPNEHIADERIRCDAAGRGGAAVWTVLLAAVPLALRRRRSS